MKENLVWNTFAFSLRLQQRITFDAFGLGNEFGNNDGSGSDWNNAPKGMGFPELDTGGGFLFHMCHYLGF